MPLNSQPENLPLLMSMVEGAESKMVEDVIEESKITSMFDVMGIDFDVMLEVVYNEVKDKQKASKSAEAAKEKGPVDSVNSQTTPVNDLGKSKAKGSPKPSRSSAMIAMSGISIGVPQVRPTNSGDISLVEQCSGLSSS
ncbi:hypothetical protein AMTRI_Chr07g28290 [Amborella trichopoda]